MSGNAALHGAASHALQSYIEYACSWIFKKLEYNLFFIFFILICFALIICPTAFLFFFLYDFIHTCFFSVHSACLLSIIWAYTGDDCKGKQVSETHTVLLKQSSRSRRLAGALWSVLVYAG